MKRSKIANFVNFQFIAHASIVCILINYEPAFFIASGRDNNLSMRVCSTNACVVARVNLSNFRPVERRLKLRIFLYSLF